MPEPTVLYERHNRVAHITLNRPEKLNALNQEMCRELRQLWRRFENDPYQPYIPFKASLELYMTGAAIDPHRAYGLGLINKVVPADGLPAEATAWAEKLSKQAPLTLRSIKYGHYKGMETSANRANREYDEYIGAQKESENAKEGIKAFRERREPVFKGK